MKRRPTSDERNYPSRCAFVELAKGERTLADSDTTEVAQLASTAAHMRHDDPVWWVDVELYEGDVRRCPKRLPNLTEGTREPTEQQLARERYDAGWGQERQPGIYRWAAVHGEFEAR